LDELQAGDQAVKATFELGYSQLDKDQARAFRLLGLADGPDISLHAAASMLDRTPDETEDLLESLVDTSLLESAAPGRYRFHDLLRLFARACAERDEQPPSERDAALSRLLDFYLATAARVYALDQPGESLADYLEPTTAEGLHFTGQNEAIGWLLAESACFLACARQLTSGATLRRAADLLMATSGLAESGVNIRSYEQAATALLETAHEAREPHAEARVRSVLTGVCLATGRFDEADEQARLAGLLGQSVEDPISASYSLNDRGIVANYQARYTDAEEYLSEALLAFRHHGNPVSEASALCNLARSRMALGHYDSAIGLARQSVVLQEAHGQALRLANCRYTLGTALVQAGRIPEGLDELNQALAIFHEIRQGQWEGVTHFRIAEAHFSAQRPGQAAAHAEQALALRVLGGEWRRATVLLVLGKSLNALGQTDRARAIWTDALAVFEQLGSSETDEVRDLLMPSVAA
ncbi:AfsR family transcriptional regulator, partial [Streptomyces sp. N2-109]|nr:AfsR family transcriptional regulator [Streptomyces gossypii]